MRDIDAIVDQLKAAYPDISVEQLTVLHPGVDDDGLWFFRHPACEFELQLESSTGSLPFLAETSASADRLIAESVEQAVAIVASGLGLTGQRPNSSFKPEPLRGSA